MLVAGFEPEVQVVGEDEYQPIFLPSQFVQQNPEMAIEDYRLTVEWLEQYGIIISDLRKDVRAMAQKYDVIVDQDLRQQIYLTQQVANKVQRWEKYNAK